jgi:2'-5' RNA ligase
MGNESVLIIPVPEVEPIVGPLRLQYDAGARLGIPAHITLLYPFCPAQAAVHEIETLRELCSAIESFSFAFDEIRRFPTTAYLHPDKSDRFVQIIRTIMKEWPGRQPYGGAFPEIIPHLTVADHADDAAIRVVEESLRVRLPIQCVAKEVWLLTSDGEGKWSRKYHFPLATPQAT